MKPPTKARSKAVQSRGPGSKTRQRADQRVVELGLAASRNRAQALILAGEIHGLDGRRIDKPGQSVGAEEVLTAKQSLPYVSRGGVKLAAALDTFGVDPTGHTCLDVGASTGGFTDCLLQRGATRVYAVDVGYGQLAWSLRQDPRVVNLERRNIRTLPSTAIENPCTLIVFDVSFISLRLVVPPALRFAAPKGRVVCLVKPQFEAGRTQVGKGGIVRDAAVHHEVVQGMREEVTALGLESVATVASPITGTKGNREFLLTATWSGRFPADMPRPNHGPA